MSNHLKRIAETLGLADSKKVTDRRTFIQDMQNMYSSKEYIEAINDETNKDFKGCTSWNQIMMTIHQVAIMEVEKIPSKSIKGNSATIVQSGCCDLMNKTVNLAIANSKMCLKNSDLMAVLFQVLGTKRYQFYQDTYTNILLNVLSSKTYRLAIRPTQWQEILRLSLAAYRHSSSLAKTVVLKILRTTVHYGCLQSNLLADVKKTLPFLETIYQEIASGKEMAIKPVYDLTYAVCQQMATENRITLCKFSEEVLPSIIMLENCSEKYNVMHLMIQIHHPGGAGTIEDGAYAQDWDRWKKILQGIYVSLIRDTETEILSPCFLRLACEVYRQIMLDPSYTMNEIPTSSQDIHPRKRRRLSLPVQKPIDMLTIDDINGTWPFVQILTVLLKKYPTILKSDDYVAFLKMVTQLVTASLNDEKTMDSYCELCTVLVNLEKEYFHETKQAESIRICWEKIWDTILRALSMNQNEILGHRLLQSIIEQRRTFNPSSFLRLYLTNAIRWSSSSVKTLLTFCECTPIPNEIVCTETTNLSKSEGSTRISLLKWCLEIPPCKKCQVPVVDVANLLTALVVKSWHQREIRDLRKSLEFSHEKRMQSILTMKNDLFDNREEKLINDIDRCNLSLNFRQNDTDEIEDTVSNDETNVRIFDVREALEFLMTNLNDFMDDRLLPENLENVITRLTIVAKLMSNFVELDIRLEPQISKFVNKLVERFPKICSILVSIKDTKKLSNFVQVIEALDVLYTIRLHRNIAKILINQSSMNYMQYIYELPLEETEDDQDGDLENRHSFGNIYGKHVLKRMEKSSSMPKIISESSRISDSSHRILTYFSCTPIDDRMSEAQKKVLKNLMKIDFYDSSSNADLRRSLNVLQVYGVCEKLLKPSQESLEVGNNFIRQLYDCRLRNETAVRGILHVLPYFVEASKGLKEEIEKLLEILSKIKKSLEKNKFGPLVHEDFVKCITRIIRVDPSLTWKKSEFAEASPIIDVLVAYVDNPFYLVRLQVVRALYVVFSLENIQVPSKVNFFKKIESTIPELFSTEEILNDCEKSDERQTRTTTAIYIYAMILRANEFLTEQALYSMIKLSARCNISITILKKALLYATKSEENQRRLMETNLHYLLSRWFESDYPLQLFPWILVHCDSQEDFSRKHIDTLLSIKLQRCEFKHLAILCKNLDVSFARTIEDSFATIMALLMSMIVQDSSVTTDSKMKIQYARQMYERLRYNRDEFVTVKSFESLLQEKLSDVVIDLVKRLQDENHFYQLFSRRIFPVSLNPPNLKVETIDRCFLFLEKILPVENESLVEYLVRQRPGILQRVLQTLFCNINDLDRREQKLQAFHQYRYFGTIVLREIQKSYFDPMSLYVIRDTSYSLLAITKEESLAEMACDYFYEFLSDSMPARCEEIKEILSLVVSILVPIAQSSRVEGAMKILNLLIIEEKELLRDAIAKLDSFPNVPAFEAIKQVHSSLKYDGKKRYNLEDEIEHFLNATNVKTLSCSHEGLINVKNQLSLRKEELNDMYGKLEKLRGFAEDCESSTLHKLIYKLVQLTRSTQTNISLEAAKCLGELGPADLTTMILHPEKGNVRECIDQVVMLTFCVITRLIDYLVDNKTNLRRASSSALYDIFRTTWGKDMAKESVLKELAIIHKIEAEKMYHYIYPFANDEKNATKSRTIRIDRGNWQKCIDHCDDLWTPASSEKYDEWIIETTCKLLDCFVNFYTPSLKPVCRESVEFCEVVLPRLVYLIQRIDDQLVNDVCLCVNRFFTRVYESLREIDIGMTIPESPVNRDGALSYQCVRCMINVVNFIRIQSSDDAPICLDYLYISKAAQYCSAYFTSVLYAELWCQSLLEDSRLLQDKVPGSWISPIDSICELRPEPGKLLQAIVREAYLHIGDPDSIYGCGLSHLIDSSYRTQHYIHQRQWDKVILALDVELSFGNTTTRGILHALQQSGLRALLERVISTIDRDQEKVDDFMYEAAWRLADWNLIEPCDPHKDHDDSMSLNLQNNNPTNYHSSHYHALKCLREADFVGLKNNLDDARRSLVTSLRKISLECSQTVYPILSQLQMLREIEDFSNIQKDNYDDGLDKWRKKNNLTNHDFQWAEPILSQRLIMYQTTGKLTNRSLIETHLDIAEIAEEQGYLQIAARSLDSLARYELPTLARDELTYQEAFLAWKRNDRDIGRYLLRNLIKKTTLTPNLRGKALRLYGNWMADTKSENPQAIIEKYYQESIKMNLSIDGKNSEDSKNLTDAQAALAQFAHAQYQQIVEFMQSPQYESLVECTKLKKDESRSNSSRGKEEMRAIVVYQRQVTNDAAELENLRKEKERYLLLAVEYYSKTLQTSDYHDLLIFRLVSLWLDNMFNDNLNDVLREQLRFVASHKFIILLPQLAPHMSNERNIFTTEINKLMERCAKEHPHHTLPVLLALKNSHKDNDFKLPEKGTQRRNEKIASEPRVLAADTLIAKLLDSSVGPIIRQMNDLSHALVALAYFNITDAQAKRKDTAHVIPRNHPIMKIRNYTKICVPTLTIEVNPRGYYDDIVGIREYVGNFDLPGGVNAPKKVVCVGTDGIRRKQLVKGQDDLRQDAVMQQVCTVMNRMLRTSKETSKRKLHIRTYKIVPLSQRSGILEWCENTLPISNILCDTGRNPGLHTKYYPNDWSVSKCRLKLQEVDRSPIDLKLETFLECCKNLHPAFHHFFTEKYPSAETWFERRLAYVKSVATTSMVGYMLGLGDRHFSNILIDQTTAEVIHIDFGVAFAQGKVLPIPETVPFRLTRDMEVAMGISGVEGVMRRSCEETVSVLRDKREILITLLQVLLYDPLFSWAITPVKSDDAESNFERRHSGRIIEDRGMKKTNKLAERALLRIEQKLKGTEDGISSSISGQVERLIQQARDPANLCRLYSGWQAYL